MRIKKKIAYSCVLLAVVVLICSKLGVFESREYKPGGGNLEVAEWLEKIDIRSTQISDIPGPVTKAYADSYEVIEIKFYNADTNELIVRPEIIKEILQLFKYTDDPYIYDEKRSKKGKCFWYYDGIVAENQTTSLFSGFQGSETLSKNLTEIDSIILKINSSTIEVVSGMKMEEALNDLP